MEYYLSLSVTLNSRLGLILAAISASEKGHLRVDRLQHALRNCPLNSGV